MTKLRIGITGFGRIGKEHAGWLRSCSNAEPVAVADATPARQELARAQGLRAFDSLDHLLADKAVDAILIATPTSMHFDQAMTALAAGKHVMIEKPMALDLAQARLIADAAKVKNRVVSVFHNRRWDADYLALRQAIAQGTFGRIINVESRLGQWSSCVGPAAAEWNPQWRNQAAFGGGGLYDWGSHFIDQLWRLLYPARPVRVFAQLRGNIWSKDCDDFARVCVDFDNGSAGLMEINTTTTAALPRWHIDGTLGSAESPHSAAFDIHIWANFKFIPADGGDARAVPAGETALTEPMIWEKFSAAARGDGEPAVSVESVLCTMALLDAARESNQLGTVVDVSTVAWRY